jgi:hypothetical protein
MLATRRRSDRFTARLCGNRATRQAEAHAGRMSPATIQTYFSFMRPFAGWIGKPRLLKPIGSYFDDPAQHRRCLAATVDKTWRAQGVDADKVIREVEALDRHAAASLRLMLAFGRRSKESLMLRHHQDVLTAQQAGRPADGPARYLDTHCGTKGGPSLRRSGGCPSTPRSARPPWRRPAAWPSAPTTASATRGARWRRPSGGCAT